MTTTTTTAIRYATTDSDRWGADGWFESRDHAVRAAMHAWDLTEEGAEEFVDETLTNIDPAEAPADLKATHGPDFVVYTRA